MKGRCFFALCVALAAASAWSQAHPTSSDVSSAADERGELFGGFTLAGGSAGSTGRGAGTVWGFNGGADLRLVPHIFLASDVSQFFHPSSGENSTSDTIFLFGPRYRVRVHSDPRASVFAEFLAGANAYHNSGQAYTFAYNSAANFAFSADAGVDYPVTRHLGVLFEAGYLHTRLTISTYGGPPNPPYESINLGKMAVDLVYRF